MALGAVVHCATTQTTGSEKKHVLLITDCLTSLPHYRPLVGFRAITYEFGRLQVPQKYLYSRELALGAAIVPNLPSHALARAVYQQIRILSGVPYLKSSGQTQGSIFINNHKVG